MFILLRLFALTIYKYIRGKEKGDTWKKSLILLASYQEGSSKVYQKTNPDLS